MYMLLLAFFFERPLLDSPTSEYIIWIFQLSAFILRTGQQYCALASLIIVSTKPCVQRGFRTVFHKKVQYLPQNFVKCISLLKLI